MTNHKKWGMWCIVYGFAQTHGPLSDPRISPFIESLGDYFYGFGSLN